MLGEEFEVCQDLKKKFRIRILIKGRQQVDVQQQADPQACTEFVNEIYAHLHETQRHYMVGDYLGLQGDITSNMTGILMDWLVEVAEEYHLTNQTLHLAKHFIDRFLAIVKVHKFQNSSLFSVLN